MGFALLYYGFSIAAASWGSDVEEPGDGPDLADRLDQLNRELEDSPDEDSDPWPIRWFWNALLAVGWAVFSIAVILVGFSRTVLTIIVFAVLTPSPSAWQVLAAFVATAGIQWVVSELVLEPQAKRLGVER
jgi:hypothetical protein